MIAQPASERLELDYLSADERHLICAAFESMSPKLSTTSHLVVSEFGRVGYSGARVFSVGRNGQGIPVVIKIGKKESILWEYQAARRVVDFFHEVRAMPEPVTSGDRGALVYDHFAHTHGGMGREELHEVIASRSVSSEDLRKLVEGLYEHLQPATAASQVARVLPSKALRRYFSTLSQSGTIFGECLGLHSLDAEFFFFGRRRLVNPVSVLNRSANNSMKILRGPVHGDLHPRNIIVDRKPVVHALIDFEFADREGGSLSDFVLLELSLQHFQFPTHVDPFWELVVHQVLATRMRFDPDHVLALAARRYGKVPPSLGDYSRALTAVAAIRLAAIRAFGHLMSAEELHVHYLFMQTLMALSTIRFRGVNQLNLSLHSAASAFEYLRRVD